MSEQDEAPPADSLGRIQSRLEDQGLVRWVELGPTDKAVQIQALAPNFRIRWPEGAEMPGEDWQVLAPWPEGVEETDAQRVHRMCLDGSMCPACGSEDPQKRAPRPEQYGGGLCLNPWHGVPPQEELDALVDRLEQQRAAAPDDAPLATLDRRVR